ncbi:MAG: hypothetical protein KC589_04855 [Nanoarchaeota archaeon]|nr:hypothetical protein [Nanoarchaeota archaeon]
MKKLIHFLARIKGLNHLNFFEDGAYLFSFPMFLLDLHLFKELIEETEKSLGKENAKKIFLTGGYVQGIFAVNFFRDRFKIMPEESDHRFYLEQGQSVGFGELVLEYMNSDKSELKFVSIHHPKVEETYTNYYHHGLIIGVCKILFSKNYILENYLEGNKIVYILKESEDKSHFLKNLDFDYSFKNLSLNNFSKKKNFFYEKLVRRNKNLFFTDKTGTFFDGEFQIFTLLSIFILFYNLSLKIDKNKTKKIYYDLGKKFIKMKIDYIKTFSPKNTLQQYLQISSLFGFEKFDIKIQDNKLIVKILDSNWEKISKKLILEKQDMDFNYFTIGLIEGFIEENLKKNILNKEVKNFGGRIYFKFEVSEQ